MLVFSRKTQASHGCRSSSLSLTQEQKQALSAVRRSEDLIAEATSLIKSDPSAKQPTKPITLFKALAVLISRQWNSLDSEQKRPYEDQAAEEMTKYQAKLTEYKIMVERKKLVTSGKGSGSGAKEEEGTLAPPQQQEDSKPSARDKGSAQHNVVTRESHHPATAEGSNFMLQPNPINYDPVERSVAHSFESNLGMAMTRAAQLGHNANSSTGNPSGQDQSFGADRLDWSPTGANTLLPNNLSHLQSRNQPSSLIHMQQFWNQQQQQSSFASQPNNMTTAAAANQGFAGAELVRYQENQQNNEQQLGQLSSTAANIQAFRQLFGPSNQFPRGQSLQDPGGNQTNVASSNVRAAIPNSSSLVTQPQQPTMASGALGTDPAQYERQLLEQQADRSLPYALQYQHPAMDPQQQQQQATPMAAVSQRDASLSMGHHVNNANVSDNSAAARMFAESSGQLPGVREQQQEQQQYPHLPQEPGSSSSFDEENCKQS